jgi:hypothetical protein
MYITKASQFSTILEKKSTRITPTTINPSQMECSITILEYASGYYFNLYFVKEERSDFN